MTPQEIYNTVAQHLISQEKQAGEWETQTDGSDRFICKYRTEAGLKCAAGCLIPDYAYSPDMENKAWFELIKDYKEILPKELLFQTDLISALQTLHDNPIYWQSRTAFEKKLKEIATLRGLLPFHVPADFSPKAPYHD